MSKREQDNTLIYGHRYVLHPRNFIPGRKRKTEHPVPHEDYPAYIYIEPVKYADDSYLGDCWVVDEDGNICPGYNTSPEPFHIDNLVKVQGVRAKHIYEED